MKNWVVALWLLPAVVMTGLLAMERMAHQETQADRQALADKLTATTAAHVAAVAAQAELEARHATLKATYEGRLASLERRLDEAELARDKALAATKSQPTEKELADTAPAERLTQALQGNFFRALNRPEMREQMRQRQLRRLGRTHAALFRKLGLDKDQIESLKGLLADRNGTAGNLPLAMLRQLSQTGNADLAQQNDDVAAAEAALRDFLGEDGYAKLERYEETLPQRQVVARMNDELTDLDAKLSEAQTDQLIDLMHETQAAAQGVAQEDFVKTDDNGTTTINLDFGELQQRKQAKNDLVMERVEKEAFLSEKQQEVVANQLQKDAANPFAGAQTFSLGTGDNGAIGGEVQFEVLTPDVEITP